MKNVIATLTLVLLYFASSAQTNWSEAAQMDNLTLNPGTERAPVTSVIPEAGVDFFMDAATLSSACPVSTALTTETWSNTLTTPGNLGFCDLILSSQTNDACFAPGGIVEGIELTTNNFGGFVVLGTGAFGAPSPAVGPLAFADDLVITFTQPVNSASFEFIWPLGPAADFSVEVFGASGSLGSAVVTSNGATPVFVGALASENITSIVISDMGQVLGELLTSLSFDLCEEAAEDIAPIPTMGEWGLMVLGIMLLIFGLVAVNQKRSTVHSS